MKKDNEIHPTIFDPPLDAGIEKAVKILCDGGVQTFESCQGGNGHAYLEPTIRFHGDHVEGFRAFAIAMRHQLNINALRRIYDIIDGELVGPYWEITLAPQ